MNFMNTDIAIDWAWVKKELFRIENIPSSGKNSELRRTAEACLKKGGLLSAPKTAWVEKKILFVDKTIVRLEGADLSGAFLASYLKGARILGIFVVTIGKALEDEASRLMAEGETLDGYFLDRIGSLAAESLAENFEKAIRRDYARRSSSVSRRLSPGYCDWPIEEQFAIAKLLDFSKAGIRLTDACMMVPQKSISAVVGIGPKGLFTEFKSQCASCNLPECNFRR